MAPPRSNVRQETSVEEQVQLQRIFRLLAFDIPRERADQKLEKLNEKLAECATQPTRDSACSRASQELASEVANYSSEREKYLATLQDEVSCGHELVSTRFQIGAKALQAIYERLGCPITSYGKSYVDDLIWQVNDNLDGAICSEEFEKSYLRARNDRSGVEPSEIFYLTCFLMFDKECNGKILLDDTMSILFLKYGDAMEQEMQKHFGVFIAEGTHAISFAQFREATTRRQGELIDVLIGGNKAPRVTKKRGQYPPSRSPLAAPQPAAASVRTMTVRCWVGLLAAASLATAVNAEMLLNPWRGITDLESRVNRREERLQAQIDQYTRAGAFPKVWRSLHSKIREANAFLEREMAKEEQRGVGASVAIVYEDEVVLSKGYGLRLANDSSSKVESTTSFQIGSVTKTFVSIGLAILIEEGKLAWNDPVKKHLPWLELYDKYAEQYVTIGDLAAMNSGLDSLTDLALFFGKYRSDEEQVRALKFVEPAHSLRGGHDYANVNFSILGLVIEAISGKPWEEFLRERIWEPLGMTRTFGSAFEARDDDDISYGHYVCGGKTLGPYSLVDDPETQLVGKEHGNRIAAGSVLSSSDDLATLLRLILNKGVVDGVTILNSTATISEMVTGKYAVNQEFLDMFAIEGHQYFADGNTLASGYGFDYVGHAQWGHAYFDKSGDTTVHVTRTGFAPDAKLGVVVVSNSQTPDGHFSYPLDHIRSYLMGIFLDVPREILEFSYRKWRQGDKLVPQLEGTPACGIRFWDNPSFTPLSDDEQAALAGKYVATTSPGYFESLEILRKEDGSGLAMHYGEISADLHYFSDIDNTTRSFIWSYDPLPQFSLITATDDGSFDINFGVTFHGPSSD